MLQITFNLSNKRKKINLILEEIFLPNLGSFKLKMKMTLLLDKFIEELFLSLIV